MDAKTSAAELEDAGPEKGRKRLSSVAMAVRLLKAFSEDEAEIGVSALSKRLNIAKSTVHRLAVTLVHEGLLEQNPESERYRLGVELFSLGSLVRRRMSLSTEARPHLVNLREITGETVLLGIAVNLDIMYIYNLESIRPIRMRSDIGVHRPAFCTAVGRAIFAFQSRPVIERMLARPLEARTARSVTDPNEIAAMLQEVQRLGYAIEDEEAEFGIRCIAAPVRNATGRVVGAVGIGGPIQRISVPDLKSFADPLIAATEAISARLGGRAGDHYDDPHP